MKRLRNQLTPRAATVVGLLLGFLVLTGCPLPFEYAPSGQVGGSAGSNDPSNPAVTNAPELIIVATDTGTAISDRTPSMNVTVSLTTDTRGAVIYYTVSDNLAEEPADPFPGDASTRVYDSSSGFDLAGHEETLWIKAIAIGTNMYPSLLLDEPVTVTYEPAAAPEFSPPPGDYSTDQLISISSPTPGATIYYTITDGIDGTPAPVPGASGTLEYTGPIPVAGSGTAKSFAAVAVKDQMLESPVANAVYTIGYNGVTENPVFSIRNGYQGDGTTFTISSPTPGAAIYYTVTTDGSDPSDPAPGASGTTLYSAPITLSGLNVTYKYKAIARGTALIDSAVVAATFVTAPRIVVTTTADAYEDYSGPVMLREAILAANFPGENFGPGAEVPAGTTLTVIEFDPSLGSSFSITVSAAFKQWNVNRSVVISGDPANPSRVRLSGGGATRIFGFSGGDSLLRDITLEFGTVFGENGANGPSSGSGGGGGAAAGGAIYMLGSSTRVTIENSIVRDNEIQGGHGGAGGGVVEGESDATGGRGGGGLGFSGYPANMGSGGAPGAQGSQGGWLGGGGAGGSSSTSPGNGGGGGFGGGGGGGGARRLSGTGASGGASIAFGGAGAVGQSSGTAGGGGGAALGGAIFVENGTLVVNNSSFVGNLASGGSGGGSLFSGPGGPGQGQGGAIFVYTGATYSGSGNTFMNNRGRDGAGNVSGEPDIYNLN